MKSYSETVNERAREQAAKGETIVMKHTNINSGSAEMPQETEAERQERTGLSSVRITDDASKAVQKSTNRISLDSIIAKIEHIDYINPHRHPHMTIALVTLTTGYVIIGKSVPADPLNFDASLGQKFAYEDAIRQIWPMEAYLLRDKMSRGEA